MNASEPFKGCAPLDPQTNPFGSAADAPPPFNLEPLEEAIGHIALRRRAIVIAGRPGTGKTSLLNMIVRSCSDRGLSVCRFDRGDVADPAIDARSDVVVVDDADSIPDSAVLALLFPTPDDAATTWVFACLPASVRRFSGLDAEMVALRGLSVDDARTWLLECAASIGRPDLFAPDALDVIVHRACGSPRILRSLASLAFFTAAWGGATRIGVRHVAYWSASHASVDVEDRAARRGEVFRRESANLPMAGSMRKSSTATARLPRRAPVGRARPPAGAMAAIAACIGLAVAGAAAFLVVGNDAGVGPSATGPIVPNPVVAEAPLVQAPAPAPVSPDIRTSPAEDAALSGSIDAPPEKAAAALGDPNPDPVRQSRAASKRTGPPAPMRIARPARTAKSASSSAAPQDTAKRVRDAVYVARQAEEVARQTAQAALQAQHAARQADDAARRADRAARRADQAASRAERAARRVEWRMQVQSPWKAMTAPRRAS